jgi:hypothetical protein
MPSPVASFQVLPVIVAPRTPKSAVTRWPAITPTIVVRAVVPAYPVCAPSTS